jgi:hypothetical protein
MQFPFIFFHKVLFFSIKYFTYLIFLSLSNIALFSLCPTKLEELQHELVVLISKLIFKSY